MSSSRLSQDDLDAISKIESQNSSSWGKTTLKIGFGIIIALIIIIIIVWLWQYLTKPSSQENAITRYFREMGAKMSSMGKGANGKKKSYGSKTSGAQSANGNGQMYTQGPLATLRSRYQEMMGQQA